MQRCPVPYKKKNVPGKLPVSLARLFSVTHSDFFVLTKCQRVSKNDSKSDKGPCWLPSPPTVVCREIGDNELHCDTGVEFGLI